MIEQAGQPDLAESSSCGKSNFSEYSNVKSSLTSICQKWPSPLQRRSKLRQTSQGVIESGFRPPMRHSAEFEFEPIKNQAWFAFRERCNFLPKDDSQPRYLFCDSTLSN